MAVLWGVLFGTALLVFGPGLRQGVRAQIPRTDSLSLAERYQMSRVRSLARQIVSGPDGFRVLPPEPIPTPLDTLAPDDEGVSSDPQDEPSFPIENLRRVRHLERTWFRSRYEDILWSFLGAGRGGSFFDTTKTHDLRARLQAQFGDPTRTLAELYSREWVRASDSTREEPIQFEYWFVVNDSIPVRVTDVHGPDGRGVVVSTDREYRDRLRALRASLLNPLRDDKRAPYVDYVYEEYTGRWYRVGFDGRSFFRERISQFDIVPGQRPRLDTVRTRTSTEEASSPSSS